MTLYDVLDTLWCACSDDACPCEYGVPCIYGDCLCERDDVNCIQGVMEMIEK